MASRLEGRSPHAGLRQVSSVLRQGTPGKLRGLGGSSGTPPRSPEMEKRRRALQLSAVDPIAALGSDLLAAEHRAQDGEQKASSAQAGPDRGGRPYGDIRRTKSFGDRLMALAKYTEGQVWKWNEQGSAGAGGGNATAKERTMRWCRCGKPEEAHNSLGSAKVCYSERECRHLEEYLASLWRRHSRTCAAICRAYRKRLQNEGIFTEEGEEEELDDEAEKHLAVLQEGGRIQPSPANDVSLHADARKKALWSTDEDSDSAEFVRHLSHEQLEVVLVDLLLTQVGPGLFYDGPCFGLVKCKMPKGISARPPGWPTSSRHRRLMQDDFLQDEIYRFGQDRTVLLIPSKDDEELAKARAGPKVQDVKSSAARVKKLKRICFFISEDGSARMLSKPEGGAGDGMLRTRKSLDVRKSLDLGIRGPIGWMRSEEEASLVRRLQGVRCEQRRIDACHGQHDLEALLAVVSGRFDSRNSRSLGAPGGAQQKMQGKPTQKQKKDRDEFEDASGNRVGIGSRVRVKGDVQPPHLIGLIGRVAVIQAASKRVVLEIEEKDGDSTKQAEKRAALGLKWKDAGPHRPAAGKEIINAGLTSDLQRGKLDFSWEELEQFGPLDLLADSYIKVDENYFKPAAREITLEMQYVKMYKHGQLFERDQLEMLIAEAIREHVLAAQQLQKGCRRFCARALFLDAQEGFEKQDAAAIFSQAMIRRYRQGLEGQKLLKKLRHQRNLQELGADLQCLDLMRIAKDGDTILVPKGRHYARVTELADNMSAWQNYMHVVDSSEVRVGSVAIVGRESMLVRSKAKGNILIVDRQVPRELLRVIAAHLRKEKYAKKIKESLYREALQELYDDSVEHAAGVYGGFERDTWQHLCNVVPFKIRPSDKTAENMWGWLSEWRDPDCPTYLEVLHQYLDASEEARHRPLVFAVGDEGIAEVEAAAETAAAAENAKAPARGAQHSSRQRHRNSRGEPLKVVAREISLAEALEMVDRWWTSAQDTGRLLKDKKKALEVPGSCLEPESRRMIEQTLVELYDAPVSITNDVLSDFLHACLQPDGPCSRVQGNKMLILKRWFNAAVPLVEELTKKMREWEGRIGELEGCCSGSREGSLEKFVFEAEEVLCEWEEYYQRQLQEDGKVMMKGDGAARLALRSKDLLQRVLELQELVVEELDEGSNVSKALQGDLSDASQCEGHLSGAMVRAETVVTVSSTICIQAEEGAEVMCSMVFRRDADRCKESGVARLYKPKSVAGDKTGSGSDTLYVLYETCPGSVGGCRPLRLVKYKDNGQTPTVLWMSVKGAERDHSRSKSSKTDTGNVGSGHGWEYPCGSCQGHNQILHQILEDGTEIRGAVENLHVRSRLGDGMRFEFGSWDVSNCLVEVEGAGRYSAIVCSLSASVNFEHCTLGGPQARQPPALAAHSEDSREKADAKSVSFAPSVTATTGAAGAGARAKAGAGGGQGAVPEVRGSALEHAVRDGTVDDAIVSGLCRHTVLVSDGTDLDAARATLVNCLLQNSHQAALRCGSSSYLQLRNCDVSNCAALLDTLSGDDANIELRHTVLRLVRSHWADALNRPTFGLFHDLNTREEVSEDGVSGRSAATAERSKAVDRYRIVGLKDWRE